MKRSEASDPHLVEAVWRAADVTRAYVRGDRDAVTAALAGLDTTRTERLVRWLGLDCAELFDSLGEPDLAVRRIDRVAAAAPVETELALTTLVREVGARETGLLGAVEGLEPMDRAHALAVLTAVMLLDAVGHAGALARLTAATTYFERLGFPRPYSLP
jgi:hypothetical protein